MDEEEAARWVDRSVDRVREVFRDIEPKRRKARYLFVELRRELAGQGHTFRTRTDTEVLVHGYEEWRTDLLDRLNGEFTVAIHDLGDHSRLLARDQFAIRPLFFSVVRLDLRFASVAKALLAGGEVPAEPDLEGFDEMFSFRGAHPPKTPFRGIQAPEPGGIGSWKKGLVPDPEGLLPDLRRS